MTPAVIVLKAPEHPIKSVTVLASAKAEVVRTFSINVEKGQNKIELRNLPTAIDTRSIRVRIGGDPALSPTSTITSTNAPRVFDLIARMRPWAYYDEQSSTQEALRGLKAKLAELESEKTIRNGELKFLTKYGDSLTGEHLDPSKLDGFLDQYIARAKGCAEAVASIDEQIAKLKQEIETKTQESTTRVGTTRAEADIVVLAPKDAAIELVVAYLVNDVSWTPTYELQTTTGSSSRLNSIILHYRANITQGTGEDWDNTSLTLSTAAENAVTRIPALHAVKVRYYMSQGFLNRNTNTNIFQPTAPRGTLFGGFGSTNAPQTSGSLFGSANVSGSTNTTGLFGAQQQPQTSSHPFGAQTQAMPTPATFGATPAPTAPFGSVTTAPPASGGLFGSTAPTASTSVFGSTAPTTASTFGSTAPTTSAGLFSATATEQTTSYDDFEPIEHPDSLDTDNIEVKETPVALTFKLDKGELVSIPSDGARHQVIIASIPLEGSISYVCVPKVDPRVFLECEMKNTSDYQLLAGPVSVVLDDSYTSRTTLGETPPNATFSLPLGTESSKGGALSSKTKILYTRSSTLQPANPNAPTFVERTQTTSYKTTVVIKNNHNYDLPKVVVKDVIHTSIGATDNWPIGTTISEHPTPQDRRVQVVLKNPISLSRAPNGSTVTIFPPLSVIAEGTSGVPNPKLYEGKAKDIFVKWSKLGADGKGGEKEGKYEWVIGGLKAGAEIQLVSEWDVQAPEASGPGRWGEMRVPAAGAS